MVRPDLLDYSIKGSGHPHAVELLLKHRLVVAELQLTPGDRLKPALELTKDKVPCRFQLPIQINCRQNALKKVRQQGPLPTPAGLLLPPAESEISPELQPAGQSVQLPCRHQMAADFREFALRQVPEREIQEFSDNETQDRVAQKLERLVIGQRLAGRGGLVDVRSVRESPVQQTEVLEAVA
jgi:hypothetical protein